MSGCILKRFALLRSFVLIGVLTLFLYGPVNTASGVLAADNLRPPSFKQNDSVKRSLISDLEKKKLDGGNLAERIVVRFSEIRKTDVSVAGGKGANLGELQHVKGISVPDGMAVTTKAFKIHIEKGMVDDQGTLVPLQGYIDKQLNGLNIEDSEVLTRASQRVKDAIEKAQMPDELAKEITEWYQKLCTETGIKDVPVAVRSSATAEDMEGASFAGQQDTYLNMRGNAEVLDAVKRDWASLFTPRAIYYRTKQNIPHNQAFLSAVIQLMIESKIAGTAFGVDLNTGMPGMINVDSAWGLGEGVVSGTVNPDSYRLVVQRKNNKPKLIEKIKGAKLKKYVYKQEHGLKAKEGTDLVETSEKERNVYTLTPRKAEQVARAIMAINKHYGMYMDVEWAIDSKGKLWILQARPETSWVEKERKNPDTVISTISEVPDAVAKNAKILLSGITGAVKASSGKVVIVREEEKATPAETAQALAAELNRVKEGDVLVTGMTKPDMVPAMKRASAIVTDEGGPTCHAAIVARELEIPCIVGTGKATRMLKNGQVVTVDANRGKVFDGELETVKLSEFTVIPDLPVTKTKTGIINSAPEFAMRIWQFSKHVSYGGYNLFRKEFVDTTEILAHPLAGLAYDKYNANKIKDPRQKQWVKENVIDPVGEDLKTIIGEYGSYQEFYVDKLSTAIIKIASAQIGGQSIKYRTTDFKTNEYANQKGAFAFEVQENNPMMGNRGLYRMLHPDYIEAFKLELKAIKRAREVQSNVDIMFPVVRTVEELESVVGLMAQEGLFDTEDKPAIGMMVEVPANIFQSEEFYAKLKELADKYNTEAFMSIGSNDLTQFTLGLGRDNDKMSKMFSENDPAVRRALEIVIKNTRKYGIKSGLCGQKPSNDPEFAGLLVEAGIDSIGVAPDAYKKVVNVVAAAEKKLEGKTFDPNVAGWQIPKETGKPKIIISSEVSASEIIKGLKTHPMSLLADYAKGNTAVKDAVVEAVFKAVMQQAAQTAANTPVIYVTDSMTKVDYDKLESGKQYEQALDENPQLGFVGLARVADQDYQEFFKWQLEGIKKAQKTSGRANIGIRLSIATNLDNVNKALGIMRDMGLVPGENGLLVGMDISKPSNVLLLNEFIDTGLNFLSENNDTLISYVMALDPGSPYVNYSNKLKEKAIANPRRVWTTVAEKRGLPIIQQAASIANSRDKMVYYNFDQGIDSFVNTVKDVKGASGAVILGANTVLDNAGTVEALKKYQGSGMKFVVWSKKAADNKAADELSNKLQALGITSEVAEVRVSSLGSLMENLSSEGILQSKVTLIVSEADARDIAQEFKVKDLDAFLSLNPMLKAQTVQSADANSINAMPLVIARAVAGVLANEQAVTQQFAKLVQNYQGRLSDSALARFNDLAVSLSEVPLVKVSDEVAEAQITYKETVVKV
jgi:pyruvate, water dikinase